MTKLVKLAIISLSLLIVAFIAYRLSMPTQRLSADLSLLKLSSLEDTEFDPQRLTGKIVVINFWATWCKPCVDEMPILEQLYLDNQQNGVQFVGVSLDDKEKIKLFLSTTPVSYPLLIDNSATRSGLAQRFGNHLNAVPYTVIVDPKGELVFQHAGKLSNTEQLQAIINTML